MNNGNFVLPPPLMPSPFLSFPVSNFPSPPLAHSNSFPSFTALPNPLPEWYNNNNNNNNNNIPPPHPPLPTGLPHPSGFPSPFPSPFPPAFLFKPPEIIPPVPSSSIPPPPEHTASVLPSLNPLNPNYLYDRLDTPSPPPVQQKPWGINIVQNFIRNILQNPADKYQEELKLLEEMGWNDRALCLKALQLCNGDVMTAVELLLANQTSNVSLF
jgi:hypothetical protein